MEIPVTNVMIPGSKETTRKYIAFSVVVNRGEFHFFFDKVEFLSENHFRQISLYLLCLGI